MEIILEDNVEYCVGNIIPIVFVDRFRSGVNFLYRINGKTYEGILNIEGEYLTYHYIEICDELTIEVITKSHQFERSIPIKNK